MLFLVSNERGEEGEGGGARFKMNERMGIRERS
jgi:hypothetical protein